jgi:hypothetical protein
MTSYIKFLPLVLFLLITACEGPTGPNGKDGKDGGYDKQIRLTFPFEWWSTQSTQWELGDTYTYLTRFNKTSYTNVDSIIYSVLMNSEGDTAYTELYDVTNSASVAGSQLSTVSFSYQLLETGNIYYTLPDTEITLAFRLRTSNSSNYCYIRALQLILYRN